jgi:hypothetical protein
VFRADLEEPPVDDIPMPASIADYGLSDDAGPVVERVAGTVEAPLTLLLLCARRRRIRTRLPLR